ncbi:hypothetical protein D3C72_1832560 [compost metagenome]
MVDAADRQPVLVGIHWAETLQGRDHQGTAAVVAIGLAAGEKDFQLLSFAQLNVLDPQSTQFVPPQRTPETHQDQRLVPRGTQPQRHLIGSQLPGQTLDACFQPL